MIEISGTIKLRPSTAQTAFVRVVTQVQKETIITLHITLTFDYQIA